MKNIFDLKLKTFIIVIFVALFFTNCKDNFSFLSKTERLTRKTWIITSMVDTQSNQNLNYVDCKYQFLEDGTLITTVIENDIKDTSEWKFMFNEEYIKIGANVFKINSLTQKIMGLKYGTIDIFYQPIFE